MKTIRGPFPMYATMVLNTRCRFENHLATVPDHVADYLVSNFNGQYALIHSFEKTSAKKILVARDMGLGDVMLTTPLVRALKQQGAEVVDVATRSDYQPLFEGNPHVRKTIPLIVGKPLPSDEYEAVIDLRLSVEQAENAGLHKNRVTAFGEAAGITLDTPDLMHLDYFVRDEEREWARGKAGPTYPGQKVISFVWCTSTQNRNWSEERRVSMIEALANKGWKVIVLHYEPIDLGRCASAVGVVNGGGKFSIRQCAAIMSISDHVISPDTGLFHVASAMDKSIIAYFGAFPLAERKSGETALDISLSDDCRLKPCHQYYCMNKASDGTSKCLAVSAERLLGGIEQISARACNVAGP